MTSYIQQQLQQLIVSKSDCLQKILLLLMCQSGWFTVTLPPKPLCCVCEHWVLRSIFTASGNCSNLSKGFVRLCAYWLDQGRPVGDNWFSMQQNTIAVHCCYYCCLHVSFFFLFFWLLLLVLRKVYDWVKAMYFN